MIRYEQTGQWPSSRRCGYAFAHRAHRSSMGREKYYFGTTDGDWSTRGWMNDNESKCPRTYSAISDYSTDWSTVCNQFHQISSSYTGNFCPKGWGKGLRYSPDDDHTVQNAQGYVKSGKLPVYGYVTRYNTKYYNYITGRVSKA